MRRQYWFKLFVALSLHLAGCGGDDKTPLTLKQPLLRSPIWVSKKEALLTLLLSPQTRTQARIVVMAEQARAAACFLGSGSSSNSNAGTGSKTPQPDKAQQSTSPSVNSGTGQKQTQVSSKATQPLQQSKSSLGTYISSFIQKFTSTGPVSKTEPAPHNFDQSQKVAAAPLLVSQSQGGNPTSGLQTTNTNTPPTQTSSVQTPDTQTPNPQPVGSQPLQSSSVQNQKAVSIAPVVQSQDGPSIQTGTKIVKYPFENRGIVGGKPISEIPRTKRGSIVRSPLGEDETEEAKSEDWEILDPRVTHSIVRFDLPYGNYLTKNEPGFQLKAGIKEVSDTVDVVILPEGLEKLRAIESSNTVEKFHC